MNKSFILSLALLAFSLGAAAQNQYWNYRSNWYITHPTSTACIAHSDGKVYFFQTDPNHMISVAQIHAVDEEGNEDVKKIVIFD